MRLSVQCRLNMDAQDYRAEKGGCRMRVVTLLAHQNVRLLWKFRVLRWFVLYCIKLFTCIFVALWVHCLPLALADCVRWEPSSPHKGHIPPIFGQCLWWPNGWMGQNATWYGSRPQRRRHCVRWHVQISKRFGPSTVLWAFHTIQPSSFGIEVYMQYIQWV